MKRKILSLFLAILMVLSTVLPVLATTADDLPDTTPDGDTAFGEEDYEALYVQRDKATLLWDAFDKKTGDTVSETAFTVPAGASYGDGFLYNNKGLIDLKAYLPNVQYGTETAQDDFTVELIMSSRAPTADGNAQGYIDGGAWYFGNFKASVKYRGLNNDRLATEGPLTASWVYYKDFVADVTDDSGFRINYSGNGTNVPLFGAVADEAYTSTLTFDMTLGDAPDVTKDTMKISFYHNGEKLAANAFSEPFAYNAANTNDRLEFGQQSALNLYAIRVYNTVLEEAEIRQNHFADLASYVKLDLTAHNALSDEDRALFYELCAEISLSDSDIEGKLEAAIQEIAIQSLYVQRDKATLLWDAFDKKTGDTVSETAFTVPAGASYGDGFLYNNKGLIDLKAYLPNVQYGTETAQDDFTVELIMSTCAPTADGNAQGYIDGGDWYFGNFKVGIKYRGLNNDRLATEGPITASWVYFKDFAADVTDDSGFRINYSGSGTNVPLFGANADEVYTSTLTFDMTLGDAPDVTKDTMKISFYRNGEKLAANAFSEPFAYNAANKNDNLKFGLQSALNLYAIRVYNTVLEEAEIRQNHFADLLAFHRPENLSYYTELSSVGKTMVQTACENLVLGAADTESALNEAILEIYKMEKDGDFYLGEDFMEFLGYSMRLFGDRDLRLTYTVKTDAIENLPEHVQVLKMGVLTTKIGTEQGNSQLKKTALTLTYAENNDFAENHLFYSSEEEGATLLDSYNAILNCGSTLEDFTQSYMVRGYVTILFRGSEVTLYEDAKSETFGNTLSLASLAGAVYDEEMKNYKDIAPERVLLSVLDGAAAVFESLKQEVKDAEKARLDAEGAIEDARERAYALKEGIKAIAAAGAEEGADTAKLQAEAAALLESVTEIEALANASHPRRADLLKSLKVKAEDLLKTVSDAAKALGGGEDTMALGEAVIAAIAPEAAAQEMGFSQQLLSAKADAFAAIDVAEKVGARIAEGNFGEVKTLRVLSIGNSFSDNAMTYLSKIAAQFDYEDIVLGVAYQGGSSIEYHYLNLGSSVAYSYHKNVKGSLVEYDKSFSLLDCLQDEDWDIITLQQGGARLPLQDTLTDGKLQALIDYVDEHKTNENAKIYFHQTWSYAIGNQSTNLKDDPEKFWFVAEPTEMDKLIDASINEVILNQQIITGIDGVIYAGTAISAARAHFGENYGKNIGLYAEADGYHLNERGRFIIGLVWFATLTGEDISSVESTTTHISTDADLQAAIDAAKEGIAKASVEVGE